MLTLPEEFTAVRKIVNELSKRSKKNKRIKIGAMIETPAAVVNIEQIANLSDFLSIGTNDLIQYTMAVGRENMSMTQYYHQGIATIMKMIKTVVDAANKYSIPCCVCGEIAGEEPCIETLLRTGIKELSVSPRRIPFVKETIRNIDFKIK
jgi:phosphotransferase system enzyme I (PtsI)